jgi:hypothetical protein
MMPPGVGPRVRAETIITVAELLLLISLLGMLGVVNLGPVRFVLLAFAILLVAIGIRRQGRRGTRRHPPAH